MSYPKAAKQYKVETEYSVFRVEAEVIVGDWEGDPNVVNGVHHLPPYVNDLAVFVGDEEITEMLNEDTTDRIIDKIMSEDT